MEIHNLSDFDDRDLESNIRNDHSNWNGRDIQLLDPFENVGMRESVQKDLPILCGSTFHDVHGGFKGGYSQEQGFHVEAYVDFTIGGSDKESSSYDKETQSSSKEETPDKEDPANDTPEAQTQ